MPSKTFTGYLTNLCTLMTILLMSMSFYLLAPIIVYLIAWVFILFVMLILICQWRLYNVLMSLVTVKSVHKKINLSLRHLVMFCFQVSWKISCENCLSLSSRPPSIVHYLTLSTFVCQTTMKEMANCFSTL